MRKIFVTFLVMILCVSLFGCGSEKSEVGENYEDQLARMKSGEYTVDYDSAEEFEEALNEGEDTLGKVVVFKVNEVHPKSVLGYNLWAGEHLNFVGNEAKDAKAGDYLTVAINSVKKKLGSWVLGYDLLNYEIQKENSSPDVTDSNQTSTEASIKTEASTSTEEPTTTEPPIIDVTAITIKGDNSVQLGQTLNLSVEFTPSDATDKSITWSSSDSNILTVDEEGVITGVNIGVATITATSSIPEIIDAIEIEVTPIPISEIQITNASSPMELGQSAILGVEIIPRNASDQTISWNTSDANILSVDAAGNISALNPGTAAITATASSGASSTVDITVLGPLISFAVYPSYTITENNSVGSDWSMGKIFINGTEIAYGGQFTARVGDVVTVSFQIIEQDKDGDDIGTFSQDVTIPQVAVGSGFNCSGTATIREGEGRYKGNTATASCQMNFARVN